MRREAPGLSVRWRLTLVYSLIAVVSAAVLLTGIYVLVSLAQRPDFLVDSAEVGQGVTTTQPFPAAPDATLRRVLVDARHDAVDSTLENLLWWSAAGLLLTAAVSVGVGWAFAGRVLSPVHTITTRARRISADALDERVSLGGPPDELRELADTFDSLLDRIQAAFVSERRLVATISHELRTPLANQRAALDVALADPDATTDDLRQAAAVALGQTERANRTIDALLTLARVQSGAESPRHRSVDLFEAVARGVDEMRPASEVSWEMNLSPVTVVGDPDLLDRAVTNLVHNAAVHNVPGGRVDVRLSAGAQDARLVVTNSGPVLSADAVAQLTLPFRRGSTDRTASDRGVGLGLSIVQAITDHHGGRLELAPLDGGGLRAELTLPLA